MPSMIGATFCVRITPNSTACLMAPTMSFPPLAIAMTLAPEDCAWSMNDE